MTAKAELVLTGVVISHDAESVDPSGQYSEDEFPELLARLECEYENALRSRFGDELDIEFCSNGGRPLVLHLANEREVHWGEAARLEDEIHQLLEQVFETGLFW